jgi:hypothetical protein
MFRFILGFALGLLCKSVYDLFKDEELPPTAGLNSGRLEALVDETRQSVRDLREELRRALTSLAETARRTPGPG